jgi:hypothetical protein
MATLAARGLLTGDPDVSVRLDLHGHLDGMQCEGVVHAHVAVDLTLPAFAGKQCHGAPMCVVFLPRRRAYARDARADLHGYVVFTLSTSIDLDAVCTIRTSWARTGVSAREGRV